MKSLKLRGKNQKQYKLKSFLPRKQNLRCENQSFFTQLVKIDAFIGDTYLRSHFTQNSFIFAHRNNHDVYQEGLSYLGLKLALQFLNRQNTKNLIFVGNPTHKAEACKNIFAKYKITYFSSGLWIPGYISRNTQSMKKVLVVYDLNSNKGAKSEAFHCNLPIVGFITRYADTDGLDYPVCLNFENCGAYYLALWKSFFLNIHKKQKKIIS